MISVQTQLVDHLLLLMDASQQGYALFDEADKLRYGNPAFRTRMGLAPDEYPTWRELMRLGYERDAGTRLVTEDFGTWIVSVQARRGKIPYRTIETDLHDGSWTLTTETTLREGWMLCVMTDVTHLNADVRSVRLARDKALLSAMTDELTQLSNRRFLESHLESLLRAGGEKSTAVALIDLDHFKSINDTYGHAAGDEVLRKFSDVLKAGIRRDDLASRYGGEEFVVVLPGADRPTAAAVLERILSGARSSVPLPDQPQLRYTCSAGYAIAREGEDGTTLLQRADQALYHAKATGRNRYCFEDDLSDGV